ncbi:hypothetical protein NIES37_20920 [Tolypothrix tenuis PCC 7101]|uniref:Uncharacterized protein n=1 Tax=Tolypothrix tenuis PCC 7101 TaxID=231146 RepID=A0A1Z4MXD7_9CYAN|nr:hypothetical protein NIES37_20920 [Tolypothrix tenuis PCC 7101]BAZ77937.1 hypothetical protein NIES50_65700 [Aulosira laxa NIES-50]
MGDIQGKELDNFKIPALKNRNLGMEKATNALFSMPQVCGQQCILRLQGWDTLLSFCQHFYSLQIDQKSMICKLRREKVKLVIKD